MIKVFKSGPHAHRTPLSYPALIPLFADRITLVDTPDVADLLVFAHVEDIQTAPRALVLSWRQRRRPVVLLSEEPFWDTIWCRRPGLRHMVVDTAHGALPVIQLNHQTSPIFAFDQIPYYLLTNHRFALAYGARFRRNATFSPAHWQERFATYAQDIVFMFERRPEPYHSVTWDQYQIEGLCAWRTKVAEACTGDRLHGDPQADTKPVGRNIQRLGHSWSPNTPPRQTCVDWHLDKLVRLNGNQRILTAFENTHHPRYISEKFFDAFACGARPAYVAAPSHGLHRLELPIDSWINCHGRPPTTAAQMLEEQAQAMQQEATAQSYAQSYAQAQKQLATLFCNPQIWVAERARLRRALLDEFDAILA